MSVDYWLGVATLPALAAAVALLTVFVLLTAGWFVRRGFFGSLRLRAKGDERVSDYILKHNIWWERQFGPVFVGGWCFEEYRPEPHLRANRWVGIGRPSGPSLMVGRTRQLGPAC